MRFRRAIAILKTAEFQNEYWRGSLDFCWLGHVYVWGSASSNKLGLGAVQREGVLFKPGVFPTPVILNSLRLVRVRQISAAASFTVLVSDSGAFSWGSGDGGRLGHGDMRDRAQPTEIEALSQVRKSTSLLVLLVTNYDLCDLSTVCTSAFVHACMRAHAF